LDQSRGCVAARPAAHFAKFYISEIFLFLAIYNRKMPVFNQKSMFFSFYNSMHAAPQYI